MYEDLGDKLSAMYEARTHELIDQIYFEDRELTEEEVKAIELAKEEQDFNTWLNKQECDHCVCY